MNNDTALKDKFCQKISVQIVLTISNCILCDVCLEIQIFTANVRLIMNFAIQLFCIFLKVDLYSKTERKKLQLFW